MSVRNILDGTIPISGVTPGSDLTVGKLNANEIEVAYGKTVKMVSGQLNMLAGTINLRDGKIDLAETGNLLNASSVEGSFFSANQIKATDCVKVTDGNGYIQAADFIATSSVKTPTLTLAGTPVLTQTDSDSNQSISVTYSDDSTGTVTGQVHSKVCNINNEQHAFTCQVSLSSLTKAIKQVIIPTGLDFTGKQTDSTNTSVARVNGTGLLLGMVHIYVENNQLMAKVVFSETPSYASIAIKINIVFN